MDSKESELKEIYRSVYAYAKHLDEQKKTLTNVGDLFNRDLEDKRIALVQRCITLIFKDFDSIGKKSREILWRKGYYDHIAFTKKNWNNCNGGGNGNGNGSTTITTATTNKEKIKPEHLEKLKKLLLEGITNYKKIASKMEEIYDLDLKLWIDYSIIDDQDHGKFQPINNGYLVDKTVGAISCALDTIHSAFLSLGDLHRYYIDFKIDSTLSTSSALSAKSSPTNSNKCIQDNNCGITTPIKITKELTAKYYFEAFKINPIIGMTQNQLGTLFYGQNYDLDSIYHYLYSLVCIVPFELSETNVCKLFTIHSNYLEKLDSDKMEFNIKDFYARLFLIIDIYFFDKDVPDFTSLCHCVLIDLKKILYSKTIQITNDIIFKIVCILFFCMSKLKMINSQKIYALNAFLVAVCSDLIDSCIFNIEQAILTKSNDNEKFHSEYNERYIKYELYLKKSRDEYRNWYDNYGGCGGTGHDAGQNRAKRATNTNSIKCLPQNSYTTDTGGCNITDDDDNYCCDNSPISIQQRQLGGNCGADSIGNDCKKHNEIIGGTATKSSDETKDSDLKTPLSNKSKKKGVKLRRRRKKIAESDEASSCCYDSESDLNSDFSSDNDDDYIDSAEISSNFESDFSDIDVDILVDDDDNHGNKKIINQQQKLTAITTGINTADNNLLTTKIQHDKFELYDDDIDDDNDIVADTENFEHINKDDIKIPETLSQEINDNFNLMTLNDELNFKYDQQDDNIDDDDNVVVINNENDDGKELPQQQEENKSIKYSADTPPQKLKFKNKYTKVDPNIIIDFAKNEPTMSALKILFDWLRINHEILLGCYHSNPEFLHKIMKLLNFLNIDIFTQKVYFESDLIKLSQIPNARKNLFELFENRSVIPLNEDLTLKSFDLFRTAQIPLDWESTIRDKITPDEENIMRILKMVDFGFYICKSKKFNYQFCIKTRKFTECIKKKRENKKTGRRRERRRRNSRSGGGAGGGVGGIGGGCGGSGGIISSGQRRNEGRTRRYSDRKSGQSRKLQKDYNTSNEEKDTGVEEQCKIPEQKCLKKGYLRNKQAEKFSSSGADEEKSENQKDEMDKKCEIMGKLWLKNEVEVLEEKIRKLPKDIVLTPFVVIDSKALVEYTGIVKELVKCKKFIVLIPNAVLGELDDLKKRSEAARNVIRWLEKEFKYGNRYLRSQRDNENLTLSLIKVPRKLNREASVFLKIAQFCNYMVTNHFNGDIEFQANAITLLSGDNLHEKKHNNFSFTGILDAIPARYDQISNFYAKLKNK